MKIKKFLEYYNTKLYSEIPDNKVGALIKNLSMESFTENEEIEIRKKLINNLGIEREIEIVCEPKKNTKDDIPYHHTIYVDTNHAATMGDKRFSIFKYSDEWYIIIDYSYGNGMVTYKCDSFKGIIQFIDDKC